ncbi:MAG: response regulator [Cyclobacteriaceae bacterium]|nr:response regulator [Cyclobacteriaceae bacterium]
MEIKSALVADDEKDLCMLLKIQLKRIGIQASIVNSIGELQAQFDPKEHDLVFLDINFPDGNGIDMIPFLKRQKKGLVIIVISAYNSSIEHYDVFRDNSSVYFLAKPFSHDDVSEIIEKVVS